MDLLCISEMFKPSLKKFKWFKRAGYHCMIGQSLIRCCLCVVFWWVYFPAFFFFFSWFCLWMMWLAFKGKWIHLEEPPGLGRQKPHRCSHCAYQVVVPKNDRMTALPTVVAWYDIVSYGMAWCVRTRQIRNTDGSQIQEYCQVFSWLEGVCAEYPHCLVWWTTLRVLQNGAVDLEHQKCCVP